MTAYRIIARWTGFCAGCPVEQPLLLVSEGQHGFRAWLAGAGPEDRALSYVCAACGRVEHVPATDAEDADYDAALLRWPDLVEEVVAPLEAVPAPRPPLAVPTRPAVVRVVTLPVQRVAATDLALTAA